MLPVVVHQSETDQPAVAVPTRPDESLGADEAESEIGVHAVRGCVEANALEVLSRERVAVRAIVGQREGTLHDPPAERVGERPDAHADKQDLTAPYFREDGPLEDF